MADWSELIHDLLVEIAERMIWYPDLLNFGRVCTSWEAAAMAVKFRFKSKVPWLMLAPKRFTSQREFFRQGQNLQIALPETNDKKYLSSHGWLMTIAGNWSMNLFHPFSGVKIELPHIKTFKNWESHMTPKKMYARFVYKFILSADPSSTSDCIILVIYGDVRRLAYCRLGDKSWITIEPRLASNYDLTYYKGSFYAINTQGHIIACDIPSVKEGGGVPVVAKKVTKLPRKRWRLLFEHFYIVESAGSLLAVCRRGVDITIRNYNTKEFTVFKVDIATKKWKKVKDLDDRALFLGHNSSFSVEVSNDTQLKSNHIYFTDDCCIPYWMRGGGGRDMGIYSMHHKSIEPFFKGESYSRINPPMWIDISYPWINSEVNFP